MAVFSTSKNRVWFLFVVSVVSLYLLVTPLCSAYAASRVQDGLEASLVTDASGYAAGEAVTVSASVTNTNDFPVDSVALDIAVPEGFKITGGSSTLAIGSLAAGEEKVLTLRMEGSLPDPGPDPDPSPDPLPGQHPQPLPEPPSKSSPKPLPFVKAGDELNVTIWLVCAISSMVAMSLLLHVSRTKKKPPLRGAGPLLLVMIMAVSLTLPGAFASAATITKHFVLSETFNVAEEPMNVSASFTYSWQDNTPVESVEVTPKTLGLVVGQEQQLGAVLRPADATNRNLVWSSSDVGVASIDKNGNVVACGIGAATITATAADGAGASDSCAVTVSPVAVTGVTVEESATVEVGKTVQLHAQVVPSNAANKAVSWYSSNESVVTVDADGLIAGVYPGDAVVWVTTAEGDFVAECSVTVSGLIMSPQTAALTANGGSQALVATLYPKDPSKTITWSSEDTAIVSVDQDGIITGGVSGTTAVTASVAGGGATATCTVRVLPSGCTVNASTGDFYGGGATGSASGSFAVPEVVNGTTIIGIADKAFSSGSAGNGFITEIILPSTVTRIGNNAFAGCKAMTSIELPDSLTAIGDAAFSKCSKLASIDIPDSVSTFGAYTFEECSNLVSATLPDNESFTVIPNYMFRRCYSLKEVMIPETVTTMGASAFSECTALTSVVLPDSLTTFTLWPNSSNAFSACTNLTTVVLPNNPEFKTIPSYIFNMCTKLQNITIPASVESIEEKAFYYCAFTAISLPSPQLSLGKWAFQSCKSLSYVEFNGKYPSGVGVTTSDSYAFDGCTALPGVYYTAPALDLDASWLSKSTLGGKSVLGLNP